MQPLLIILLLLSILTNVLLILLLLRSGQQNTAEDQTDEIARIVRDEVEAETEVLADQLRVMQGEVTRTTSASARDMGTLLAESQRQSQEAATARLDAIDRAGAARQRAANDALLAQLQVLETRLKNLEDTNANRLDGVRATLLQGMANIRADNNKKLDEIRGTVDEKLETTLQRRVSESFRAVSTQLEQVYKGLGEMQNLAADVGSLKQVLSGVKTRGILGEVQLGAILKEILAPGQYAENVATVPGSSNRVEYAVKLPGQSGTVWLPIDAKFPGDTYAHLQDAQASGDPAAVAAARRQLETVVRQEAKDIHDKYIERPTPDFRTSWPAPMCWTPRSWWTATSPPATVWVVPSRLHWSWCASWPGRPRPTASGTPSPTGTERRPVPCVLSPALARMVWRSPPSSLPTAPPSPRCAGWACPATP